MKIKQKLIAVACFTLALTGVGALSASPVSAETKCGDVKTSIIGGDICAGVNDKSKNAEDTAVWKLLLLVLNVLTAGVGIAAVGGIVYGSILYASAADRADQTKKAIGIITNVVIGVIAYAVMYMVLNFLIPGGIFK